MSRDSHLPTLFGRATLVSDGHTTLKESARALRELCDAAQADPTLPALLDTFAERVLAHFSVEEGGAYFGTLAEDSPELLGQIAVLKNEHGSMRTALASLRQPPGKHSADTDFMAELGRFLDRFEAHEAHESRVLERFFLKDHGGPR